MVSRALNGASLTIADDALSTVPERLRAALDAGINLIDTGDFYGSGHNELLIREALTGRSRESANCTARSVVLQS